MPSRQYEWQLKMKSLGKCIICGKESVNKSHCEFHRRAALKRLNKSKGVPDKEIGPSHLDQFTDEQKAQLGTKPDKDLAEEWGMKESRVWYLRNKLGIKPFRKYEKSK